MYKYSAEDYASLCALTYFDVPSFRKGMLLSTYIEQLSQMNVKEIDFYTRLYEEIMKSNFYKFMDLEIVEYVNENHQSGLVYYRFEDKENCYLVFRGSEAFDNINHDSGWEDWRDNLEIFLGITHQQLRVIKMFQKLSTNKKIHLIGHSKGGNLALFLGVVCNEEKMNQISEIVTFNAPGINDDMIVNYEKRLNNLSFLNKIFCYENEFDPISSLFHHVKAPILLKSKINGLSVMEAYESHQIWSYEKKEDLFVIGNKKSPLAQLANIVSNQMFNVMDEESRKKLIHKFMEYCEHDCTLEEMYHVILYNIGLHRNLLNESTEFKNIEIETLLNQFHVQIKNQVIQIPENVRMTFDNIKDRIESWVNQVGKK